VREIIRVYAQGDSWYEISHAAKNGARHMYVSGTTTLGKALLAATAEQEWERPVLIITSHAQHAERLVADLEGFVGEGKAVLFPPDEALQYGVFAQSPELVGQRLGILARLALGDSPGIVVAAWDALLAKLAPPDLFRTHTLHFQVGLEIPRDKLMQTLSAAGYERVELTEAPGQFSVRGGLIDIYPLTSEEPVRIEFYGDEIDSIRGFDLTSQRTTVSRANVLISPATEAFWEAEASLKGIERIEKKLSSTVASLGTERAAGLKKNVEQDLEKLRSGLPFPAKGKYLSYFVPETATLFDFLPSDSLVLVAEPTRVLERAENAQADLDEQYRSLLLSGHILPDQFRSFVSDNDVLAAVERFQTLLLSSLPNRPSRLRVDEQLAVLQKATPNYHGQLELLRKDMRRLTSAGYHMLSLVSTKEKQADLIRGLREEEINAREWSMEDGLPPVGVLGVSVGVLEEGIELPDIKLHILSEGDLMARTRQRKRRQIRTAAEGARLSSYRDLSVGDYVVHVHHGIGKYLGIKTMDIAGIQRDYIEIRYNGEDKLYVPTEQLHLVQKYVGAEGKEPKLHALGSSEWGKTKVRVTESVEKMAEELVALYAQREAVPGFCFSPDKPWQAEMEDSFPYVETPDQLRSIDEVKADMEQPKVMDRLLCGDVGYGKTEVAVRAAFKAVLDGKQVAILVPTTILAQQHYKTFKERFSGFPIEIALLSRFRGANDNRDAARRISAGLVDIAIGTHRLFNADVRWKDLGLVVIDEEQRFGVAHKEKLKMLKNSVDVLTLSATPIPRTLHMAMVGLRDVSAIETPPEDRYPVQTYVIEHQDGVIKNALERELVRGGQVYYVHNRVRTIKSVAVYLQSLVPEARIAIGHGQMPEEKLERIFLDFLDGEYDILLSTTIIESGLDIPNVNTIIVEDADRFGLAQLYQLRGRVGRSTRLGYAYLTYRPEKSLTEVAEKRLSALREFTQLGAGFKIALRDLEIRGAGNLLGPEQHGSVASVGFDLYCQLLEDAVRSLRGAKPKRPVEVEIKLPVDAYFPSRYIRDSKQKVEMYKRVAAAHGLEEIEDVIDELIDRYGEPPEPVMNLLGVAKLKIVASKLGITLITTDDNGILCKLSPETVVTADAVTRVYKHFSQLSMRNVRGFAILWRVASDRLVSSLPNLITALQMLGESEGGKS